MSKNSKSLVAFLFGVVAFVLLFVFGEAVIVPRSVPAAAYINATILLAGMGAYFLVVQYFLSRGNPRASREDRSLLVALDLPLVLAVLVGLVVEPNKTAILGPMAAAAVAVACSYAGAVLAARAARN